MGLHGPSTHPLDGALWRAVEVGGRRHALLDAVGEDEDDVGKQRRVGAEGRGERADGLGRAVGEPVVGRGLEGLEERALHDERQRRVGRAAVDDRAARLVVLQAEGGGGARSTTASHPNADAVAWKGQGGGNVRVAQQARHAKIT